MVSEQRELGRRRTQMSTMLARQPGQEKRQHANTEEWAVSEINVHQALRRPGQRNGPGAVPLASLASCCSTAWRLQHFHISFRKRGLKAMH
eukprot:1150099-Pelagomonas_calceolata.AAC.13